MTAKFVDLAIHRGLMMSLVVVLALQARRVEAAPDADLPAPPGHATEPSPASDAAEPSSASDATEPPGDSAAAATTAPGAVSTRALAGSLATPSAPAATHERVATYWYGKSIMIADAGVSPLFVLGIVSGSPVLSLLSTGLSGPIVHLAKGRSLEALLSFGLRVGLPVFLLVVVPSENGCDSYPCNLERGAKYAAVSLAGAILLDWTYLSRGRRTVTVPARTASWTLTPTFGISEHGASLGVLGRF